VKVGEKTVLDIACGGDPTRAVAAASLRLTQGRPWIVNLTIRHDDGCPCLNGRSMLGCTCELVTLEARRVA